MLNIEVKEKQIEELIEKDQSLELLAGKEDGLIFTEGPIWNQKEQSFIFSDIAGNKMYQWNDEKGLSVFANYSFKANGNAMDSQGNVISCEHATSRIVRRDGDGSNYEVLCTHYEGKELNSPNDVIVKSNGDIYFTDPHFGRNPSKVGVERKRQLSFRGVYCLSKGNLFLEEKELEIPNGLCFSADEKKLFINDSVNKLIKVYDVTEEGRLQNGKTWAVTQGDGVGLPDGMKLDRDENLYCCAQGGIHIFNKEGLFLGRVVFPVQVANFCFGGKDGKEMFICATDKVYRIKGKVRGL